MPDGLPIAQIQNMQSQGMDNNTIIQTLQRDGYSTSQIFDALNQSNMTPMDNQGMPPPPQQADYSQPASSNEEMIEAIINEKWNDLVKDINKLASWKESMTTQITRMDQRLTDLKDEFDKLHEAVIGKIGEYDKNILDVGAEVKAMEKVFSKVLPVFTENVAELSRITSKVQKK